MKLWQVLKNLFIDMWDLNKVVLKFATIITIFSIAVFVLNNINPIVNNLLAYSILTPWGIITYIFVHGNLAHIGFNLSFLWIWTIFMVFENDLLKYTVLKRDDIKKRLKFMVISVFILPIVSAFIWTIILRPGTTVLGSSGVVYALSGACLISSLMNISFVFKGIKLKDFYDKIRLVNIIGILAINIMVFALIFMMVTTDTSSFFGFGDPQINSFVHWTSFIATFFTVFAYEYCIFYLPTIIRNIKTSKRKKL